MFFIHTPQEFISENYLITLEMMEMENVIYFQKNQISFFQTESREKNVPHFFIWC